MPKDSMVLEYRAQVVRRSVADKRERTYGLQGIECYFFGVSEDTVMDSTYCGSLARFTVRTENTHVYRTAPLCVLVVVTSV